MMDRAGLLEVMLGSCTLCCLKVRLEGELTTSCLRPLLDRISLLDTLLTLFGSSGTGSWREAELCRDSGLMLFFW